MQIYGGCKAFEASCVKRAFIFVSVYFLIPPMFSHTNKPIKQWIWAIERIKVLQAIWKIGKHIFINIHVFRFIGFHDKNVNSYVYKYLNFIHISKMFIY